MITTFQVLNFFIYNVHKIQLHKTYKIKSMNYKNLTLKLHKN